MRFKVLDSWRGIAALLVALMHVRFLGHFYDLPLVRHGWLWVDFFFVLSGFVITHAYRSRLQSTNEALSFVIRRFGRLWPLHAAVLAAFLCLEVSKWGLIEAGAVSGAVPAFAEGETYSLTSLFTNVALIHSLGVHDMLTWNTPSWSISTEFYVCVLFAIACLLPRTLFRVAVPLLLIISAAAVARSGSYLNTTYDYGFFRCALGFFTGHLTYRLHVAMVRRGALFRPASEWIVIAIALVFVASFGQGPATLAAPIVFSIVVLVFASESGPASRLLLKAPFQKLGEWSYSIYMVHMLISAALTRGLLVIERLMDRTLRVEHTAPTESTPIEVFFFSNEFAMDGAAMLYLTAVVGIASVTYRWIEVPCRAWFNRRSSRFTAKPSVAPAAEVARRAS